MPTLIFNNISELKTYIGGAINLSLDLESIAGSMHDAARNHLITWLGKAQWNRMVAGVAADDLTDKEELLLPYVQRALAQFTMYEYSKIGGIQFSEGGIFRTENEQYKSAYKYQENEYRDYMLTNAWESIEEMLSFLEENEADYALWAAATAYARNKSLIINDAATFRECFSNYVSRYTFELLRPIIEDLEVFALIPLLGQEQYDEIKTAILEKDLTDEQKALLRLLQKAVANFTIREGSRRLWVRLEGRNVVQSERLEPQSYEKITAAAGNALRLSLLAQDEWGNRYISRIKKHLDDNLADFPLYDAWKTEQEAAAATVTADGCFLTEDGTGNWQLENAPGALNTEGPLDRGACSANCQCSSCAGSTTYNKPVFRL